MVPDSGADLLKLGTIANMTINELEQRTACHLLPLRGTSGAAQDGRVARVG